MIFYLIFTGFALLSISWFSRMIKTVNWISKNKKIVKFDKNKEIFVVIPVLDEAKRIESTVDYFSKTFKHLKKMKIILVTTESEYTIKSKNIKNTIDLAKDLSKSNKRVVHYHYPIAGKKMAHQLNYAIKKIIKKKGSCLFAIYNADSRPHKKTFDWVLSKNNSKVFQQYGCYFKNVHEFKNGFGRSILWSAAGWQTRWSIGFELNHAIKQLQFLEKKRLLFRNLRSPLNYCIGHGLFFTTEIFKELKGFNEDMHNEDAIFGLELSYLNEKIMPIPYFEDSDSPNTIKSLFIQKSTWFFGPLQAFSYIKEITKRKKNVNFFKLFILASKLFSHAIYWVIGPTLMVLALILTLVSLDWIKFLLVLIMIITFLILPNYFAWLFSVKEKRQNRFLVFVYQLIGGFFCYFLHGLSAYKTLMKIIISKITGKNIKKIKTPNN